jgi:hypothetical protein
MVQKGASRQMSHVTRSSSRPEWWDIHQQALQLFRDFDALQRICPYLVPSSLAYQRLEREQARIEAAIELLRRSARGKS